jgi:hypothetical protein
MRYQQVPQPFYIRNSAQIIMATGLLFLTGVIFMYVSQYLFIKKASKTSGFVTGFDIPKGKLLGRPIIEYYTPDRQKHIYHHTEGTNPPEYRLGQKVTVYYNPLNLEEVSLGYTFIPMIILSIFGLIFTAIGIAMRK